MAAGQVAYAPLLDSGHARWARGHCRCAYFDDTGRSARLRRHSRAAEFQLVDIYHAPLAVISRDKRVSRRRFPSISSRHAVADGEADAHVLRPPTQPDVSTRLRSLKHVSSRLAATTFYRRSVDLISFFF